jgi:nitrous oxidase accessory protein
VGRACPHDCSGNNFGYIAGGRGGAATLTVNASGGADYMRIQDAIDNATARDTILVYSGTYYENVNVNKQLVLKGIDNGGGKPVVDARGSYSAITLNVGGSMLEGFTAINVSGPGFWDAGIKVYSNDNILINNTAANSTYGIFLDYSSNNTLSGNIALNNSEGICIEFSTNNTLSYNTATWNQDEGILLWHSSNSTLIGNNASNNNIGISVSYFSNNNTLINNIASSNNFSIHDYNVYLTGIWLSQSETIY